MKIISPGCTCYIKNLIKNTTYNKSTDIVDWVNLVKNENIGL